MRGTKMSAVGTNPKFWSWQIAGVAPIPWPARLWPRWSMLRVKENVIGFLQLSWYQLFGKPQHHPCGAQHGWFAHWLLMASFISSPIKLDKVCKVFLEAFTGRTKWTPLGKDLLCPNGRSLGQGLAPASWSQFFSGSGGLGPEHLLVYVFFHWQSRKEEIQISGGCLACGIASATSLSKIVQERLGEKFGWPVLLLVTKWFWWWGQLGFHHGLGQWKPIARKAWQASGLWPLGIATLWMKCLMIGNMAKHSEAWQENFPFCLWLIIFFLEK